MGMGLSRSSWPWGGKAGSHPTPTSKPHQHRATFRPLYGPKLPFHLGFNSNQRHPQNIGRMGLRLTAGAVLVLLVCGAVVALLLQQVAHQDAQQPHGTEHGHDGQHGRLRRCRLLWLKLPCPIGPRWSPSCHHTPGSPSGCSEVWIWENSPIGAMSTNPAPNPSLLSWIWQSSPTDAMSIAPIPPQIHHRVLWAPNPSSCDGLGRVFPTGAISIDPTLTPSFRPHIPSCWIWGIYPIGATTAPTPHPSPQYFGTKSSSQDGFGRIPPLVPRAPVLPSLHYCIISVPHSPMLDFGAPPLVPRAQLLPQIHHHIILAPNLPQLDLAELSHWCHEH